jgi:translation initiation factor IF-2
MGCDALQPTHTKPLLTPQPRHRTPPPPPPGVTINTYQVIYNLIDDVKAAMEGRLRQVEERIPQGSAKVKAVFGTGKKRVAGCEVRGGGLRGGACGCMRLHGGFQGCCMRPCMRVGALACAMQLRSSTIRLTTSPTTRLHPSPPQVLEGKLVKGCQVEVKRGKEIVYKGTLTSLRRVKDNVDEVPAGMECGIGVDSFTSWNEGDAINCFMVVTKSQKLEEAKAASLDLAALAAAAAEEE